VKRQYKLQKEIAHGTFGTVFKAKSLATGKKVAIKNICVYSDNEREYATILREI